MSKIMYVGIGSNLGNRERNIKRAMGLLKNKCRIIKMSSLYETEPVGYKEQGWFLNCALKLQTDLNPEELINFFQSIEKKLGRVRAIKNGPRTIDLDILFYGSEIIKTRRLAVPHPRLHKRLFVLEPLNEICPELVHPKLKKRIGYLKNRLSSKEVVHLINPEKASKIVSKGYTTIAEKYQNQRNLYQSKPLLLKFIKHLPKGSNIKDSSIIDLGCGVGIPVTKFLADKGFKVMGIDFAGGMLKLAKKNVPNARFIKIDMTKLKFKPNSFDGAVSFYAIIHVPREKHHKIYKSLLKSNIQIIEVDINIIFEALRNINHHKLSI